MKMQDAKKSQNTAVFPLGTVFLSDVLDALTSNQSLYVGRSRDLLSAVRRVGKALGMPLSDIPADPRWLREHLIRVSPPQLRVRKKTWANVLSNVRAGLKLTGLLRSPFLDVELTPAWQHLLDELKRGNDRGALTRFIRFCCSRDVEPEKVSDTEVVAYRAVVDALSLTKRPDITIYYVTTSWNRLVDSLPDWPPQRLSVPRRRHLRGMSREALPVSFVLDLDTYLREACEYGPFDETGRSRPLAPDTIRHHDYIIRRFVRELTDSGVELEDIKDLRAMLTPSMFERGLRALYTRRGKQISNSLHVNAVSLLGVATRYLRLPDDDLEEMRALCKKLKVERRGMTEKNRGRLRPFEDQRNVALLLGLPAALLKDARSGKLKLRQAAMMVEIALAIELLIAAALRIKNLSRVHLDNNLQLARATEGGGCHLVIPREDVKNREHLEIELPKEVVKLLREYLQTYRPVLVQSGSRWLFGTRKTQASVDRVVLARRISTEISRRTGLVVNAHLFRALLGKLYLDRNPGGYEVVRRFLGHKSIATTIQFYTGMESISNAKHFDETIRQLRSNLRVTARRSHCRQGASHAGRG